MCLWLQRLLWHKTHKKHSGWGVASWSCLQCKQLGKKGEIWVLHREKQVAGSPGEQCLHSWSYSVGSGTKQLCLKWAGNQTQQWKGNWERQRQVQKHNIVILSDLSLRIPKLRAPKGEELFRETPRRWLGWTTSILAVPSIQEWRADSRLFLTAMWIASGSGLQHPSLLMAVNTSLAVLDPPLPTYASSKAKEADLTSTEAGAMPQSLDQEWSEWCANFLLQPGFHRY